MAQFEWASSNIEKYILCRPKVVMHHSDHGEICNISNVYRHPYEPEGSQQLTHSLWADLSQTHHHLTLKSQWISETGRHATGHFHLPFKLQFNMLLRFIHWGLYSALAWCFTHWPEIVCVLITWLSGILHPDWSAVAFCSQIFWYNDAKL